MNKKYNCQEAGRIKLFFLRTGPLLLLLAFLSNNIKAQLLCGGYKIKTDENVRALNFEKQNLSGIQSTSYQVRVCFHIVNNDDGTNASATPAQVASEFNTLVADYAPAGICFLSQGYTVINSTKLNTNYNINNDPETLFDPYNMPNCINIFYLQKISGTNSSCKGGTCGIGGYSFSIPHTFNIIANGNIGYRHTVSHETGHCMGLLHTFEPSNGFEDIDGSNSATAADQITDTKADPYAYNSGSYTCFSETGNLCNYTGSCTDPNGKSNFSPPYTNTMGYWGTNSCYSTPFSLTNGQYTRVKSYLSTNSDLENCESSTSAITEGPNLTVSGVYLINSTTSTITTSGTVNITGSSIVELTAKSLTIGPGFSAIPTGNGSVWLKVAGPCVASGGGTIKAASDDEASVSTTGRNTLMVYPNPASTSVNIAFTLAHEEKNVALQVYDLNGKRVKEINLTNLPPGAQNIPVRVNDISAGIYFVMVRMDDATLTAKVVVVK